MRVERNLGCECDELVILGVPDGSVPRSWDLISRDVVAIQNRLEKRFALPTLIVLGRLKMDVAFPRTVVPTPRGPSTITRTARTARNPRTPRNRHIVP